MSSNILDPSALLSLLPSLLPPSSISSPQDAIAALLHSIMSTLAFRLIAIDETSVQNLPSATVLPTEWNKNGPGHYTFKYRHDQSSLEFVLKVSKLGAHTLINAIAVESDKVATLDINTNDFVSPSFFPHDLDDASQPLVHGFISSNRVADLTSQIKLTIIQHLVPGLRKDGYTEDATTTTDASPSRLQDPTPARPQPQQPQDLYRPPSLFPPRNPLEIGRSDLDPFPVNPFTPPDLFPQSGNGMFVGPGHPIFGGRRPEPFGDRGPWGGDGYLPPMGAPPGARFDPTGPGPRGPFSGGPFGGRRLSGDPDNDEFMPPGAGDM
ncbi:hypothetical protein L208DRAFT_1412953 [Tricholoma matsutake]|nr:hypothetical protein L208DRAFT_1412953 [Tricholoma matsutake 945]